MAKQSTERLSSICVIIYFGSLHTKSFKIIHLYCKKPFIYKCSNKKKWVSVQFSHSVVSDYLQSHEPQHARTPCPSPTAGVYPNPCPSNCLILCHSLLLPQSFPASGSFQMSQFFTLGGQSIGVLASTSVLPKNIQDLSPLGWTQDLYYLVKL